MFYKMDVLENIAKFTRKHQQRGFFFKKVAVLLFAVCKFIKNETITITILNYQLNILFVCYHFKANEIKTSLLKPVRIEAGLGNPPSEFTTNDAESGNFIKHGINFDKQKPQEFIEKVREIINMQFRNEDRAVFGKGPYNLRKGFEKYYVNDFKWGQLTAQQRLTKIKEFRNVCMSGKDKEPEKYSTIS